MAERKSGPVKPPVIDLKAREAAAVPPPAAKAEPYPADQGAEAANASGPAEVPPAEKPAEPRPATPPPPPRPQARLAMPWSAIGVAAAGGAVLGTVLTYLLVNVLPLPDNRPVIADPAGRLAAHDASLADLGTRLAAVEEQGKRTQVSLDATLAQLDSGLNELRQSIAALPAPAAAVDIAPLQQQLQALEDRMTAIGAGASSADASTLATTISGVESGLADLSARLAALDTRLGTTDAALATLKADVAAAKSAITAQNQTLGGAEIGPAVRLPLLVSSLGNAFGNGRPFASELASLTTLLPDLQIPAPVASAAATGLPRPDAVAARFSDIVPAILSGRSGSSSGDWGQDALDWMKGLIALRPVDEMPGDTPEAVVSRLEGAVSRRDFVAAAVLLDALPAPMQAAAGAIGDDIRALAAAETFIGELSSRALAPATEPAT